MGNAVAACCDSNEGNKNELTVGDQSKYTMDAPTKTSLTREEQDIVNNFDKKLDKSFAPKGAMYIDKVNPSGSKYKGHMVDGIRTGYGVYTYADGVNHYEGQWQNNKAHGLGRFKEEESEYKGQWQDGEKHGVGEERWFDDHTVYTGMYINGRKEGFGTYKWADGSTYEGQFQNDSIHGRGIYKDNDGTYTGEFHDATQQGFGRFEYPDGSVYEGQFFDAQKHGEGRMVWTEKADKKLSGGLKSYRGQWRADQPHGRGIATKKDGKEYEIFFDKGEVTDKMNMGRQSVHGTHGMTTK